MFVQPREKLRDDSKFSFKQLFLMYCGHSNPVSVEFQQYQECHKYIKQQCDTLTASQDTSYQIHFPKYANCTIITVLLLESGYKLNMRSEKNTEHFSCYFDPFLQCSFSDNKGKL